MSSSAAPNHARWYLTSVATFMLPMGMQSVMLPYLLAIELHQSADRYGVTQMLGQLPMFLLILFGGWLADRVDARRLLIWLHVVAMAMPLVLVDTLWRGQTGEAIVLLYAVCWGVVSAFAMPARDGMLASVAGGNVQRMVTLAMGAQFGMQIAGQALGGQAKRFGPIAILLVQCAVLGLGAFAAMRLPAGTVKTGGAARGSFRQEFGAGLAILFTNVPMRATLLFTCGMGVFLSACSSYSCPWRCATSTRAVRRTSRLASWLSAPVRSRASSR